MEGEIMSRLTFQQETVATEIISIKDISYVNKEKSVFPLNEKCAKI